MATQMRGYPPQRHGRLGRPAWALREGWGDRDDRSAAILQERGAVFLQERGAVFMAALPTRRGMDREAGNGTGARCCGQCWGRWARWARWASGSSRWRRRRGAGADPWSRVWRAEAAGGPRPARAVQGLIGAAVLRRAADCCTACGQGHVPRDARRDARRDLGHTVGCSRRDWRRGSAARAWRVHSRGRWRAWPKRWASRSGRRWRGRPPSAAAPGPRRRGRRPWRGRRRGRRRGGRRRGGRRRPSERRAGGRSRRALRPP